MTVEREQAPRGLGGRAALEAYRAARLAQRGDLRAALRANREALRAARVLPAGVKAPEQESVAADASPPPVMAEAAAPRSVFASLVEAERALAPPAMAEEAPAIEEATTAEAVEAAMPEAILPDAVVEDAVVHEPVIEEPIVADAPVEAVAETPDTATVIDVTAEAPAAIDLVEDTPAEAQRAATDLSAIRELGPGMRHRLAQIGYHSCEDLAAADPARLSQQLGEVSRLLRPESWIAAARAAIG